MPNDRTLKEIKDALTQGLLEFSSSIKAVCDDDHEFIRNYLNFALTGTRFRVIDIESADSLSLSSSQTSALSDGGGLALEQQQGAPLQPRAKKVRTLPQQLFEHVSMSILIRRAGWSMQKSVLVDAIRETGLNFGNHQAITTRFNKMRGDGTPKTELLYWEPGKQNAIITVTETGKLRLDELNGSSTRSLTLEQRQILDQAGCWFGGPLDQPKDSPNP